MNIRSFITLAVFVNKRFSMCLSRDEQLKKLTREVKISFEMFFSFFFFQVGKRYVYPFDFYALNLIRNQYKILYLFILNIFIYML